jgi:hypothetical protein
VYIAGLYTSNFGRTSNAYRAAPPNAQMLRDQVTHHLESYHYIKKGQFTRKIREDGVKVFLDSGAFSAFTLGHEIDIGEYAEFIAENQDIVIMASVLDAIGDHEATFRNQQDLERRNLPRPVLPCFHFGEPMELAKYYADNYEYITIGGMVPVPNQKLGPWLDELWEYALTDKDGYAKTKVHGFGLTALPLMYRYPWYSVDSSSWVQAAANGLIQLPELLQKIDISARSPRAKDFLRHFSTYPQEARAYIEGLIRYYGLTPEELATDYKPRWALNAFAFDQIGKRMGDDHWRKPFRVKQPVLFAE